MSRAVRPKILIIEDDAVELARTASALSRSGFDVAQAGTGDAALRLVGEFAPSLVLLDTELADVPDTQVLRRIKADPSMQSTTVLLMTVDEEGAAASLWMDSRVDGHIERPISDKTLLARVRGHMRQHELVARLRASEARFRELIAHHPDGMLVLDHAGIVRYANPAACALLGREGAALEGTPFGHPAVEASVSEIELPEPLAAGSLTVEMRVAATQWEGEPARVATLRDVSERKRVERLQVLLSAIVNSSADAIIGTTLDGVITSWNPGARKLLGYSASESIGQRDVRHFPPERYAEEDAIQVQVRTGQIVIGESQRVRQDGTLVDVSVAVAPLADERGNIIGSSRTMHDITARKRTEAALRESARELRALAEAMPQMVWIGSAEGGLEYANGRWYAYTGQERARSLGDGWFQAFHPADRVDAVAAWRRAIASGGDYGVECRLRGVDGEHRWMLIRALPHRDAGGGRVARWIGTCTDIEDVKRAEGTQRRLAADLDAERARLLAAQAVAKIGSWETDSTTLRLRWSAETHRIFETDSTRTLSYRDAMQMVHPDDRARVNETFWRSVRSTSTEMLQHRILLPDGRIKYLEQRWNVTRGDASECTAIGTCQDISQRVALEERLRDARRLEAIGQLTGGVAHDFNNLLTVILGNGEMLQEQLAGQARLEPLARMVVTAAERGAELTRSLLAFARKQALAPQAVDANRLVGGMGALLRRTLGAHIEIALVPQAGLWRALVDPAQLENAVLNLCLNARDAMPEGGRLSIMTANVQVKAQDGQGTPAGLAAGDYVMLAVSDTGSGIAAEHMGRVFEPFFTTKGKAKAAGLGLAMIYGFVKQSGGHVAIESRPGRGTLVQVYLPRTQEAAQAAEPPEAPHAAAGGEVILLVEDDELVRRYAQDRLVALGYRVMEAHHGAQALEVLATGASVDLLLTDVVMPGMSGRELADEALRLRPGLRVLYTSGYSEDAIVHHGRLDAGVQLLAKPYTRDELARALQEVLKQSRR